MKRWKGSVRGALVAALAVGLAWTGVPEAAAQEPGAQDTRPGVAVFPLDDGGSYGPDREDLAALGVGLQQMLLTELSQSQDLRIVERSTIREILEEQDLAVEGRVDPGTAARVGQIVGARYIITGSFIDFSGDFRLDLRIIDGETSEILRAESVRDDRSELYGLLVQAAERIMEGMALPPLPTEQREAREAREIPSEAITLYSRAQVLEDVGETDEAMALYQRILSDFPQMTEVEEALAQIQGS